MNGNKWGQQCIWNINNPLKVWFCQCSKTVWVLHVSDAVITAVAFQFAWVHYCVIELFCMHPLLTGPVTFVWCSSNSCIHLIWFFHHTFCGLYWLVIKKWSCSVYHQTNVLVVHYMKKVDSEVYAHVIVCNLLLWNLVRMLHNRQPLQHYFDICGTVHHHSINKNNQRDAACSSRLYYALW